MLHAPAQDPATLHMVVVEQLYCLVLAQMTMTFAFAQAEDVPKGVD